MIVADPNRSDLELAERMVAVCVAELAELPENSELVRALERQVSCWRRIAVEMSDRILLLEAVE